MQDICAIWPLARRKLWQRSIIADALLVGSASRSRRLAHYFPVRGAVRRRRSAPCATNRSRGITGFHVPTRQPAAGHCSREGERRRRGLLWAQGRSRQARKKLCWGTMTVRSSLAVHSARTQGVPHASREQDSLGARHKRTRLSSVHLPLFRPQAAGGAKHGHPGGLGVWSAEHTLLNRGVAAEPGPPTVLPFQLGSMKER